MDIILVPLLRVFFILTNLYINIVVLAVVFSWLLAFGILKISNRYVFMASRFFSQITDPVLSRIRQVVPPIANIDFSPFILILGLIFLQEVIVRVVMKMG